MHIGTFVRTIIARLIIFILIVIAIIPVSIMMLLPARIRFTNKILYRLLNIFYWAVLKGSLVPITYKGLENVPDEPVVFVSNHQSSFDIPLIGILSKGKPQLWLARSELMKTWLLRFMVSRLAVVVDVNSRERAMASLRLLMRFVKGKNIDIMIFPEGQRFTDNEVHEFFGGFVTLAKLLKRPVVPVRIFGANKVYPPNTFLVKYHPITVVVGKPFTMQEDETDDQFKQRVYEWFINQKG